jgi:hypothetical protein
MPFVKIQKKSSILGEPTVSEKQSFSYAPYPLPLFFWDYNQSGSPHTPLPLFFWDYNQSGSPHTPLPLFFWDYNESGSPIPPPFIFLGL